MLPSSGAIDMSAIDVELSRSPTALIHLNETAVRTLLGIPTPDSTIDLQSAYGKAAAVIALVNVATKHNTASQNTLLINKPTGTATGNLMVAYNFCDNGSSSWTGDTSWTELGDWGAARVAYKIATASEPSSYTFTNSGSNWLAGFIATFSGALIDPGKFGIGMDTANPLDAPGLTATANGSRLITTWSDSGSKSFDSIVGMNNLSNEIYPANITYSAWHEIRAAGATGFRSSAEYPSIGAAMYTMLLLKPG